MNLILKAVTTSVFLFSATIANAEFAKVMCDQENKGAMLQKVVIEPHHEVRCDYGTNPSDLSKSYYLRGNYVTWKGQWEPFLSYSQYHLICKGKAEDCQIALIVDIHKS